MIKDKRKNLRRALSYNARIHAAGDAPLRPCTVSDISDTGAKLDVAGADDLPDSFELILSGRGNIRRRCRVVWRKERQIGVRFEKAAPQCAPKRVTVPHRAGV